MGGQSEAGPLSRVESFGFEDDCEIPNLPEARYGFAAFKTFSNQLAVCGGWWEGKLNTTDCLLLDTEKGQWVRGAFEGNLHGEAVRGVASFEDHGIYVSHSRRTSQIEHKSTTWTLGPEPPVEVECACKVSISSFVVVGRSDVHEYSITKKLWEDKENWPSLTVERRGVGCAATLKHLVVAGGVTNQGGVLSSIEVYGLRSKKKNEDIAADMVIPRSFFSLVLVGQTQPRLLAIGGRSTTTWISTSEYLDEEGKYWEAGPSLQEGRSNFGSLMIEGDYVCSSIKATCDIEKCPLEGSTTAPEMETQPAG